jgi:hypothetical protein
MSSEPQTLVVTCRKKSFSSIMIDSRLLAALMNAVKQFLS